jgi:hypothetical protein
MDLWIRRATEVSGGQQWENPKVEILSFGVREGGGASDSQRVRGRKTHSDKDFRMAAGRSMNRGLR